MFFQSLQYNCSGSTSRNVHLSFTYQTKQSNPLHRAALVPYIGRALVFKKNTCTRSVFRDWTVICCLRHGLDSIHQIIHLSMSHMSNSPMSALRPLAMALINIVSY